MVESISGSSPGMSDRARRRRPRVPRGFQRFVTPTVPSAARARAPWSRACPTSVSAASVGIDRADAHDVVARQQRRVVGEHEPRAAGRRNASKMNGTRDRPRPIGDRAGG